MARPLFRRIHWAGGEDDPTLRLRPSARLALPGTQRQRHFAGNVRQCLVRPSSAVQYWRVRREFGEHGGVTASVEASTSLTVLEAKTGVPLRHAWSSPFS